MTLNIAEKNLPRLANSIKPIRFSRVALWIGLFAYLALVSQLLEEKLLPPISLTTLSGILLLVSMAAAVVGMIWVCSKGLQGLLYGPQRGYRKDLMNLSVDTLKSIANRHPELSNTEKDILRQVLNRKCPGWSDSMSTDVRLGLSQRPG